MRARNSVPSSAPLPYCAIASFSGFHLSSACESLPRIISLQMLMSCSLSYVSLAVLAWGSCLGLRQEGECVLVGLRGRGLGPR